MFLTWCNTFSRVSSGYCKLLGLRQQWNSPWNNTPQIQWIHSRVILKSYSSKNNNKKNPDQQIISLLHSRDGILLLLLLLFGLGERKQCRKQRLVSTPVCDKGISETPASSGAGIKRGTSSSSSSSPQQQLVPRRGVDTHSQAAVAARNRSPDNRFSFTNSTNKAASPRPSRPTCSHTLLAVFFLIFVHMCQCV